MPKLIDLRSDTVTKPSPAMRAAMASAEVGDDVFGEDPTVNELQDTVARLLDKEAALFVPSGTMGNQIAIKTHTQPGNEIICETDAHIFRYEGGAPGLLSGVMTKCLAGNKGILTADQIAPAINASNVHSAPTGLIALENTHNRAGGTVYPLPVVEAIGKLARERRIPLHLDGARLFNACVATNTRPAEYARHFDSVTVCLSKGLGAPAGSVLTGTRSVIDTARYFRKVFGGGMRQSGVLAAAGLFALRENFDKLREDHVKARKLAEAINEAKFFSVEMETVQTNIVIFNVNDPNKNAVHVTERLGQLGILCFPFGERKIRFVTHSDVSMADIDEAIRCLQQNFN